jgi:hypothetical protein
MSKGRPSSYEDSCGDYKGIMLDTVGRSYSEKRLKQARLEYSLLGSIGKQKSFDRFIIER